MGNMFTGDQSTAAFNKTNLISSGFFSVMRMN